MVKKGFSLVEALIVMGIVSILLAAGTKVITKKPKAITYDTPHGYYECFIRLHNVLEPNRYNQRYVREGIESDVESNLNKCTFEAPVGASNFSILSIPGINPNGFTFWYSTQTATSFQPSITNKLNIKVNPTGFPLSYYIYTDENPNLILPLQKNENEWIILNILDSFYPNSYTNMYKGKSNPIVAGLIISW